MSLLFRAGRPDDVPVVARLASHSFPALGISLREWEDTLLDSPHGGVETLWVGERDGHVIAACRLFGFEQWIGGRAIRTMGLGTVAISPLTRRQGLAGQLTCSAFEQARARGEVASALYPFRTSFYRKLGYGIAGEVHQFRIPPAALPGHGGRSRVTLVETPEDREAVARIYDAWAPRQTGQLRRRTQSWELVWQRDTRHGALYRDEGGSPAGYVVFRYLAAPPRGGRTVEVEEIVWLDRPARLALYAWLASLSDQWDQLLYRAHPEEGFPEHLAELRFPADDVPRWHFWFSAATALYGPMFRLLDFARAWGERTVGTGREIALALEVHDEQIVENAGNWTLRLAGGSVEVSREPIPAPDLRIQIGIEALSRLFIGALSPSVAVATGLASVDHPERLADLDSLLRLPRPWTFDRF